MGICRSITLCVLLLMLMVSLSNGEIHRTKTGQVKTGSRNAKSKLPNVAKSREAGSSHSSAAAAAKNESDARMAGTTYEVWMYSIFGAIAVGLSGIFPLLVIPMEAGPSLKHGAAAAKLKLLLSFAVGGLLGDVFLHLLPEAWGHTGLEEDSHSAQVTTGLWVITGMLSFLIIEKIFAREGEFEHLADECEEAQQEERESMEREMVYQSTDGDSHAQTVSQSKGGGSQTVSQSEVKDREITDTQTVSQSSQNGSQILSHSLRNGSPTQIRQRSIPVLQSGARSGQTVNNGAVTFQSGINNGAIAESDGSQPETIKVSGYLNLGANVIDNFTHGLAVAGGFMVSTKVGCITLLAILLHEIPHEVGDFAILLRSGFDRWKAAKAQMLTATGGVVGALTALTADSAQSAGQSTAWILPFTSGGFIYIALVTVVPDLIEEKHQRESIKQIICVLSGITCMYFVCLIQ